MSPLAVERVAEELRARGPRATQSVYDGVRLLNRGPSSAPPGPSDTGSFAIDEAEITFWGLCPDCQSNPYRPGRRDQ